MHKQSYIPQTPSALNMSEVYLEALKELSIPYPSYQLPDWTMFNQVTGGFRMREFSILCGSTGAGKTTFLANLSAQLLKAKTKHFVMSVETGHTDYMKRILSVLCGQDINQGGAVNPDRLAQIHAQNHEILESGNIEFALYENRLPVEQLLHDLEFMRRERGCKIAFIDNLNFFMEVTRASDQIIEMDRTIHELVIFCKRVDMHIVMVMHPGKGNGKSTGSTRVETEYDIKGSSTAVQEAHNVFLFNRPKPEDLQSNTRNPFQRELKIAKMRRRGQFVGRYILLDNQGTRYMEAGIV